MIITCRAPVRIDFGGAWTDVDEFACAPNSGGGLVLNAAIDKYVTGRLQANGDGLHVFYGFDLPSGSGLGTSAALNVVWLSLVRSRTASTNRAEIADLAYRLEEMLGVLGGRQDQYAAALGGFQLLHFGPSGVLPKPVQIAPVTVAALESRSVLCYTGTPRLSGTIHENVWGAFWQGRPQTISALFRLRDLAKEMARSLETDDLETFARQIGENWECQKALDDSVTNEQIERLFDAAYAAGAIGGKACGAGGGGCLYFVAEAGRQYTVANALAAAGARMIPFRFAFDGLTLQEQRP